jgi:hypothetical protein
LAAGDHHDGLWHLQGSAVRDPAVAKTLPYSYQTPQAFHALKPVASSIKNRPRFTPQTDIQLSFATWTEFEETCGQTRFWAGVHFPAAIPAVQLIGRDIGARAYHFLADHTAGTAQPHRP